MYHRVAVPVEIQTFLSHRRGGQHKRPERRVKRAAYSVYVFPRLWVVTDRAVICITTGKVLAHGICSSLHSQIPRVPFNNIQTPRRQLQCLA